MFRGIKKVLSGEIFPYIFWATLIFYFLLFLNLNNKTLLLAFLILVFIYFFKIKNFRLSLLLTTISSLPFLIGKTYVFELIAANKLNLADYPSGYNFGFTFNVFIIFSFLLLVVILIDLFKRRKINLKFNHVSWIFLFFYIALFLSSLIFSQNPEISFWPFLNLSAILAVFIFIRVYNFKKLFIFLLAIFSAMVIFESCLVGLQYANKGSIGRSIEFSQETEIFGRGVDEDFFQYRPIGTFSHANELAAFLIPLLILLVASLYLKVAFSNYLLVSFLLGLIALVSTLSRSAWLCFALSLFALAFIFEKRWKLSLNIPQKIKKKIFFIFLIVLILSLFFLLPRILKSFYSFGESGGFYTRMELIKESWRLFLRFPFFGVGLGLSPKLIFEQNPYGVMSYFPSAVHNGFLLLSSETGIISLVLFLFFIFFSIKKSLFLLLKNNDYARIMVIGSALAIFTILMNWLAQPLYATNLSFLVIFTLINDNEYKK